jgi:predicted nucleic acid-binding protein
MLRLVIDTCIVKMASFPSEDNPAALIVQMGLKGLFEWWVSPAILDEYTDVMSEDEELLAEILDCIHLCYPLTELSVISHEPDNRFVECALSVDADYLITVNCARGHFDQPHYDETRVLTPGRFIGSSVAVSLLRRLD